MSTMLEGGEVTREEALAIQLWYTWFVERGDAATVAAWLGNTSAVYIAAQKWMQMEPCERDVWIAVAAKAEQLCAVGVGGDEEKQ